MKLAQASAAPAISQVSGNGTGSNEATGKGGKAAASHPVTLVSSAKVQISSTAKALMESADSGVDQAKVDRVRQSISNGTYKVNPEAIADKLIANAQDVLGKVSPR
jgi:negative regulator of flagellin synthesis FlgM